MAALTRGMEWIKRQWTYEPFAEHERLQVQVSPDLRSREGTMFRGFLRDLDDETASAEFKAARSSLLAMGGIAQPVGPLLELLVQLEVYPLKGKISSLVEVMQCFSRESFYVSRIAVLLVTPQINIAEATELLRVVHSFRDTARVDIHVDIPAGFQDHTSLTRWKALFDLAARKSFADPALDGLNEYTVSVEFGDQEYRNHRMPLQAKATTATACLSALAHVGSHVTSVTTTMAMQVHKKDRHVRAKYLGYMLRIGTLKELTVKEQCLSDDDVDHILGVYCNTSHKECIRALWEEPWHGSEKAGEFEREDAERLVPDRQEVIGVMQDIVEGDDVKEGDETIDVFLIGYGQCGVERDMLPLVREVEDATKELALPDPSLKSLTLKFMNGKETLQSIIRLVGVVGRRLEELTLDLQEGAFPLMMILLVLESCRGLRKLTIKALGIAVQDDSLPPMPLGTQRHRHLVSLSIELATFENTGGL